MAIKPRLKRIAGRLLLVTVPVLVILLVLEIGLRVAGPPVGRDPGHHAGFLTTIPSAELGWIFPADTTGVFRSSGRHTPLATNRWGLRSGPVSDADTTRLLVLGDSYAFGWGVAADSSFGSLLGAALGMEVVNGAIPGYSIYQQVRMLDLVAARTDVDLVVATISLANDAIDEERIRRFAPDRLAEFDYGLRDPASSGARLIRTSRLLTVIDERTTHLQFGLKNARGPGARQAIETMSRLAERCRALDVPLVWVIVPRAGEVRGGGAMARFLNRQTARLRERFLTAAGENGFPGIDLLPVLREAQTGGECYLPHDAHWNERGHRAVAAALLPHLEEARNGP
jgi:lysophospholipase L1-like esterase